MSPTRGPERTCVGCRRSAQKDVLLRLVRARDGEVMLDPGGRAPGRGAYVHRDHACVERALAKRAAVLVRALRARADLDAAARLRRDIEGVLHA